VSIAKKRLKISPISQPGPQARQDNWHGGTEMYELRGPFDGLPRAANTPVGADASPHTPILITEQQVLFGTAAAMPLQPAKSSRRWAGTARSIGASLRSAFPTTSNDVEPHRRHYPSRKHFLEESRMTREMLRL
jgi:hypothetical protein